MSAVAKSVEIKITQAKIDQALSNHRYIKVDGNGELMLTGAVNYWKDHPEFVYVPKYRLAGAVEKLRSRLVELGVKTTEINNLVSNAYTKDSVNAKHKDAFENEVSLARDFKRSKPKEEVLSLNLTEVVDKIKNKDYTVVATVTRNKDGILVQEAKSDSRRRKSSNRNSSFAERYSDIESGFVFDVSSLTADGKGAKTIKSPTEASSKKVLSGLNLASITSEGMKNALALLGKSERLAEFEKILTK
jgi:hypothetical protein